MDQRDFRTEFSFRSSRSSGSGGQHVNKVESRVELLFQVADSDLLTEDEKTLLLQRWSNRLNKEGFLRLVNQSSRSQLRNKQNAIALFYELLEKGLHQPKKRKKARPNPLAKAKRLLAKRLQSEKKLGRKKIFL